MSKNTNSSDNLERQGFCNQCGRNFHLENMGDEKQPLWVLPQHVVRKNIGKSTRVCKGSLEVIN